MKEELILFETAKLAKEKGFNESILYFYDKTGNIVDLENVFNYGCEGGMFIDDWYKDYNGNKGYVKDVYSAPTQSLLQKWLREVHGIHIDIKIIEDEEDYEKITGDFNSYEEALEVGLQEALKLIKNSN